MREKNMDYLLVQNENEARDWLEFLENHKDKDELKTLENEISNRFFYKFDVQIETSQLDDKRAELISKDGFSVVAPINVIEPLST